MPRNIFTLCLFISLDTYSIQFEDMSFFTGCSSQYEPVLDSVKTASLSLLSNLRVLDPELSITAKVSRVLLKISYTFRVTFILILFKYKGLEGRFLVNSLGFIFTKLQLFLTVVLERVIVFYCRSDQMLSKLTESVLWCKFLDSLHHCV